MESNTKSPLNLRISGHVRDLLDEVAPLYDLSLSSFARAALVVGARQLRDLATIPRPVLADPEVTGCTCTPISVKPADPEGTG